MPQANSSSAADLSPIQLTNLSPDSFFGSYEDPQNQDGSLGPYSQRYYLYKANDTLVVGGQAAVLGAYLNAVPAGNNVSIQATDLIIAASFPSIPQADIQIYCRHLTIPAGATVKIDVSAEADDVGDQNMAKASVTQAAEGQSGANGTDVAKAWAQDIQQSVSTDPLYGTPIKYAFGQNGENGGNITIICDELELDGTLILNAKGRNGYSGCPGQQGGSAATGQTAGKGGDGQSGGQGGNGGNITVQYRTLTSGNIASGLQMNANLGQPGQPGAPGLGGSPNGADGSSPSAAFSGSGGSTIQSTFSDASLLGQAFDEIYLLKAVETAKLLYMLNEPMAFSSDAPASDGYKAVQDMLVWLQSVLSGYATLSGDGTLAGNPPSDSDQRKSNLYLIASTYAQRIGYVPPVTSAGNVASSIPGWTIYQPPNTNDPNNILQWVENTYLSDGTNTLSDLKQHCADYMTAFNTLMQDEVTAEKIQAQYEAFAEAADSYQTTFAALCAMLDPSNPTSIAGQLSAASTALLDDFNTFSSILAGVQDTIASHFTCSANDVLTNLSQAVPQMLFMASEPELMLPMAAASMSPLIMDGINKIPTNSGLEIDKSQIITDLKVVTGDPADFINNVKGDLLNPDGSLKSSTTYVLAQLDMLSGDISNLSNSIDQEHPNLAEQALATIDALKQAIITKSQLQLQYQSYAAAAATTWQNYQDANARKEQIEAIPPNDPNYQLPTPDLLGHVSHLAMLYQKGLTDYIAFSSQFKRFAAWLSLDNTEDPDLTQMATMLNSYWTQGSAPQPSDLDTIDSTLDDYETKLQTYFLNQQSPAFATPANSQNPLQPDPTQRPEDLVVSITADCILNLIRQGVPQSVPGQAYQWGTPITFVIVPFGVAGPNPNQWGVRRDRSYPPQKNKDGMMTYFYYNKDLDFHAPMVEFSKSGNFYDLRAYAVQPRIIGATYNGTVYGGTNTQRPQSIMVNIEAFSTRWFWTSAASENQSTDHLVFTHPNSRVATFEHYYDTTSGGTAYDVPGGVDGKLSDANLSLLGIYGPWTIRLSNWTLDSDPNAQIDFSTVTEIQLGFAGTARNISGPGAVRRERSAAHAAS